MNVLQQIQGWKELADAATDGPWGHLQGTWNPTSSGIRVHRIESDSTGHDVAPHTNQEVTT